VRSRITDNELGRKFMDAAVKTLRDAKHLKTEADFLWVGESDAEVAFVGRSNAGKSSLINAVCQRKKLAHASQMPGKTRTINVYEVKFGRWMVDLPGYGYAVGTELEKDLLAPMIEGYLLNRAALRRVFVVVDVIAGPTHRDLSMILWLARQALPFSVVVNKIDKVSALALEARKKEIVAVLAGYTSDIYWVSSKKNIGLQPLQELIARLLNTVKPAVTPV